ncbi:unnamed protein product [Danaus chrysippus]|uniref:Calcyclin-binding protein n=1 Tax=Danaus chrysippus TaxID=151541 RepID=A0A8J2QMI6_9NEOP|nr:unnamed protein product [Danaus chrysippus]
MSDSKVNELKSDVDELKDLLKQAKRKKVQDLLSLEIRKLETEVIALKESSKDAAPMEAASVPTTSASSAPAPKKRYQVKINGYGWDQNDKFIKVFVTLKNVETVPKENVYCKLTNKSMELHIDNLDNKDHILIINKLLHNINVEDSYWKQKNDTVIVYLAKDMQCVKWSHMTEIEKKFDDQRSNRFKTDDKDNVDPQESIMSLMKNMYESGDDDMKRMISKAWYEGQQKKKLDTLDL